MFNMKLYSLCNEDKCEISTNSCCLIKLTSKLFEFSQKNKKYITHSWKSYVLYFFYIFTYNNNKPFKGLFLAHIKWMKMCELTQPCNKSMNFLSKSGHLWQQISDSALILELIIYSSRWIPTLLLPATKFFTHKSKFTPHNMLLLHTQESLSFSSLEPCILVDNAECLEYNYI